MSSSWILLELDTTPPEIEIYSPRYTTREIENEIRIVSNEKLSTYQDIYVIDSQGNRHDYTFQYNEDEFIGHIRFNELPYGICTIYAQLKDEVDNFSPLVSKSIEIKESLSRLNLTIDDSIRNLQISDTVRNLTISDKVRDVQIYDTDII